MDRLEQVPARLSFLFDTRLSDARGPTIVAEMSADGADARRQGAAPALAKAPRLDRARFRAIASELKARTGQKARRCSTLRVALTGRAEAQSDLAIPASISGPNWHRSQDPEIWVAVSARRRLCARSNDYEHCRIAELQNCRMAERKGGRLALPAILQSSHPAIQVVLC